NHCHRYASSRPPDRKEIPAGRSWPSDPCRVPDRRPQWHLWRRATSATEKREQVNAGPWLLPLLKSYIGELLRVTQHAPEGLARGGYGGRQRGVIILKKTHYLHQQQLEFLPQLGERHPGAATVKGLELRQQIIDLIL